MNNRFGGSTGSGPFQPHQPRHDEVMDANVEYDLRGPQQNTNDRNNNVSTFGAIGDTMRGMMYNTNNNNNNPENNTSTNNFEDSLRSNTNTSSIVDDSLFSSDDLQLLILCANAGASAMEGRGGNGGDNPNNNTARLANEVGVEESWVRVKDWLHSHTTEEVRQAAGTCDDSGRTALHFACRNQPPIDIVHELMSTALDTVKWTDNLGWLPLHYASVYLADHEVIKTLTESYPLGKTTVDTRGRTPLHLVLGIRNNEMLAAHSVVAILSSSGAAKYADYSGMLPLHYACAYGASEEVLYVLTGAHNEGIRARDRVGRAPLHFALSNADNEASPTAVQHLLELDPDLANSNEDGSLLPLRVLANFANNFRPASGDWTCKSVRMCLEHLLNAKPDPTPDFFTALQSLPVWLSEHAVVMPRVQMLLNDKISQRFPSAILMADFILLLLTYIFYFLTVKKSLTLRFKEKLEEPIIDIKELIVLIVGISYFFIREMIQIMSFISMKAVSIWFYDVSSWLNVFFVALIGFWTAMMNTGGLDNDLFRTGTALTVAIIWFKFVIFFRQTFQTFAVFWGAMIYILRRLTFFVMAMVIFLIAFTQMFTTEKMHTRYYNEACFPLLNATVKNERAPQCTPDPEPYAYCNYFRTFLHMLTMLLGEVDDGEFTEPFDLLFFLLFMVLMVVILATVLIAIVTDSYKIVQTQRSAIVFWTNRLHFVAQVDAISSGFQNEHFRRRLGTKKYRYEEGRFHGNAGMAFGKEFWKSLIDLFEDEVDASVMSADFWIYNTMRLIAAVVIIPAWFSLGLLSLGWLWPPQLREFFWTAPVTKYAEVSEEELRKTQVMLLDKEVKALSVEITHELTIDRIEVVQMKSSVADKRAEIANEMRHIKNIMTRLFDQQAQQ